MAAWEAWGTAQTRCVRQRVSVGLLIGGSVGACGMALVH